jgi:hypothetical protein
MDIFDEIALNKGTAKKSPDTTDDVEKSIFWRKWY